MEVLVVIIAWGLVVGLFSLLQALVNGVDVVLSFNSGGLVMIVEKLYTVVPLIFLPI